ncbi:hypothetical protein LIPSTDRAFT_334093, partial [Lipomyces starkeyi NRRL Y-11557]
EELILKDIKALEEYEFPSIRSAAHKYEVSSSSIISRMAGTKSCTQLSHEPISSSRTQKTLVRWITRLTAASYTTSPALLEEIAEVIRTRRVQVVSPRNNEPTDSTLT